MRSVDPTSQFLTDRNRDTPANCRGADVEIHKVLNSMLSEVSYRRVRSLWLAILGLSDIGKPVGSDGRG